MMGVWGDHTMRPRGPVDLYGELDKDGAMLPKDRMGNADEAGGTGRW